MTAVVVLALSGFSAGRGHGGTSSSGGGSSDGGGGGGGCSSSSQDHDTSSSSSSSGGSSSGLGKSYDYDDNDDDYDDDSYGDSSTGGTGSGADQLEPATVRLVKCATVKEPYATVEVTNPNPNDAAFWVDVSFKDRNGATIKDETWKIDVLADDKVTVDIEMARKSMASSLDHCVAEPEAEPIS
ncbi:hypothetical protein [Streptomyces europaeiscabiei]|uniref:hypothetical protein n=1 Tax=Streptomyces europaeiscabiei TaxID=146819 RepID=UPI002E2E3D07|nr:hypothetical protein [Streptomyces europaeiscabiei]